MSLSIGPLRLTFNIFVLCRESSNMFWSSLQVPTVIGQLSFIMLPVAFALATTRRLSLLFRRSILLHLNRGNLWQG